MRAVSTAEQGMREGAALAAGLLSQSLIPAVKGQAPKAAGTLTAMQLLHTISSAQWRWRRFCSAMQSCPQKRQYS